MDRTTTTKRLPRPARSLPECLRKCLTPAVWKQAQRGLPKPRTNARWGSHHLVLVLLAMTWSLGESSHERFEMARGIVALCRPKRRRAGQTVQGFHKALARVPMRPLIHRAAALRLSIFKLLGAGWVQHGFVPLGCDGSRLECPKNDALLARMGKAGKTDSTPGLWVTAIVHMASGVPWSWQLGQGNASERAHLQRLLPTLPKQALVVADAGYHGHELASAILSAGGSFLIRMSSQVHLFVDELKDMARFDQGPVVLWPGAAQDQKRPPLRLRLIRVRVRRRAKTGPKTADVWLLTNVAADRMSIAHAAYFYRMRWENEGLFRTYKRTLSKVHLVGRTVRTVHREAYGSLLACQLLLAQGAWAIQQRRPANAGTPPCSARRTLLVIRSELKAVMRPQRTGSYVDRLSQCTRDRRKRTSAKQKRTWPRRTPHKPPKPPQLLTMDEKQKALYSSLNPQS